MNVKTLIHVYKLQIDGFFFITYCNDSTVAKRGAKIAGSNFADNQFPP